jgi:hypothetical protein
LKAHGKKLIDDGLLPHGGICTCTCKDHANDKKKTPPTQKQRRKKTMEGSLPKGSSLKVYVFIG